MSQDQWELVPNPYSKSDEYANVIAFRLKLPRGWLVWIKTVENKMISTNATFVDDPNHEWQV